MLSNQCLKLIQFCLFLCQKNGGSFTLKNEEMINKNKFDEITKYLNDSKEISLRSFNLKTFVEDTNDPLYKLVEQETNPPFKGIYEKNN